MNKFNRHGQNLAALAPGTPTKECEVLGARAAIAKARACKELAGNIRTFAER